MKKERKGKKKKEKKRPASTAAPWRAKLIPYHLSLLWCDLVSRAILKLCMCTLKSWCVSDRFYLQFDRKQVKIGSTTVHPENICIECQLIEQHYIERYLVKQKFEIWCMIVGLSYPFDKHSLCVQKSCASKIYYLDLQSG